MNFLPTHLIRSRLIRSASRRSSRGLTLVELMVAMAISAVIAIAAVSALIVSRQGFTTVDAASQLRDNARFAADLIQRIGVQSGFSDVIYSSTNRDALAAGDPGPPSNVFGFNNSTSSASDPAFTATARTGTSTLGYGSDVLVLRYQTVAAFTGATVSDNSMINCMGVPRTDLPTDRDSRLLSVLHVAVDGNGEPALYCTTDTAAGGFTTPQPIVRGVENFQVLYGVDNVVANTAATASATFLATNYLRADQLTVASNAVGTSANWRRVRSIKIGMVLRGEVGSAQQAFAQTYFPFGLAKASAGGTAGSALASTLDPGTIFTSAADTRLRQVISFTIHLRNDQSL